MHLEAVRLNLRVTTSTTTYRAYAACATIARKRITKMMGFLRVSWDRGSIQPSLEIYGCESETVSCPYTAKKYISAHGKD
jgi:hypothetical protein